jgi:hypothetical protein
MLDTFPPHHAHLRHPHLGIAGLLKARIKDLC